MWNNSHWKLKKLVMRPCTNKAERKTHEESGREGREAVKSDCAPGRGLRKRETTQVEILPEERVVWTIYGCPRSVVQNREDGLSWLVGGLVGLIGGLWETCCPLVRNMCTLRTPEAKWRGRNENHTSGRSVFCNHHHCVHPSLNQVNAPAPLGSLSVRQTQLRSKVVKWYLSKKS